MNLIIRDRTRWLSLTPIEDIFPALFVPELADAVRRSPFREIFLVTTVSKQLGFIPLKMLLLLSEAYFFDACMSARYGDPRSVTEAFASYFSACVTAPVRLRADGEGTEVIYGDTGILIKAGGAVVLRAYADLPFPSDARATMRSNDAGLIEEVSEFKKRNQFRTGTWFPLRADKNPGSTQLMS